MFTQRHLVVLAALILAGPAGCGGNPTVPGVDALLPGDEGVPSDGPAAEADLASDVGPVPDTGAFDMAALPGLVLWLDAGRGVTRFEGGVVAAWADQSGNANDAGQSITYNRPTYTESAINGLPGIHFDSDAQWGQFLSIPDAASLQWGTGDFTLAVVARYDNDGGGSGSASRFGTFYFKQGMTQGLAFHADNSGRSATGGFAIELGPEPAGLLASTGTGYDDLRGHLFVARRVGTTLQLRHNGTPDGSKGVPILDVSAPKTAASIGATLERIDSTRLDGDISEVIALKGAVSDATLTAIEAYLRSKYGLP